MNKNIKLLGLLLAITGSAFSITLCSIGLTVYVIGFLLETTLDKGVFHPYYPGGRFLIPLLISLLISLFISHYFKVSLRGLFKFIEGFILLYAAVDVIRTPKELRIVIFTLGSVFFFAALAGICQDVFGRDFVYFRRAIDTESDLPKRITGALKHYNDYGSFLAPGFPVILALFLKKAGHREMRGAVFFALLFAMLCYAMFRTLSRSAILAVFTSLLFFGIFFRHRWITIGILAALVLAVWIIPSPLGVRFKSIANASTPERLALIKITLSMIKAKPLFGLGLNTYSDYFPQFRPANYHAAMYAHNSYLQIAAEAGLVGLFCYLSMILALVWGTVKAFLSNRSADDGLLTMGFVSAVIAMMTNALFESLLQSTQLRTLFWCFLGIATALTVNFIRPQTRFLHPQVKVSS